MKKMFLVPYDPTNPSKVSLPKIFSSGISNNFFITVLASLFASKIFFQQFQRKNITTFLNNLQIA